MRCGICGKDTMGGNDTSNQVPIYDADALSRHKKAKHPAEYQTALEARRIKTEATKQAQVAEAQRVHDARLAASKPVVSRYRGEEEAETYPSSRLVRYQLYGNNNVRFPDPEAYHQYLNVMATIAGLEAVARAHLTTAWEMGTPVPLEHLDELDRAAHLGGEYKEEAS